MIIHVLLKYPHLRGFFFLFTIWLACLALATFHAPARAQTNWIGGASGDWFVASNWSTGVLPGAGDDVLINAGSFAPSVMNGSGAAVAGLNIGGQFDGNIGAIVTGKGSLSIINGAQLANNANGFFGTYVGVGTGSVGSTTISGAGSTWTNGSGVLIGAAGATGSLTLENQGTATFGALIVGASLNDILGPGLTNSSGATTGTLTVTGGSQLTASSFADVGAGTGTNGKVIVSGAGSTFSSDGGILVGVLGGSATFDVLNGGTLVTGPNGPYGISVIGGGGPSNQGAGPAINGGVGAMTISGAGSSWTNTGSIYVGGFVDTSQSTPALYFGTGTLTIADGGKLISISSTNTGLPEAIGLGTGSIGTAVVTGAGSQWTAGQHLIAGYGGGNGTLTIENGGTVDVAGLVGAGIGVGSFTQSVGTINVLSGGALISNSGGLGAINGVNIGGVIGGADSTGAALVSGAGASWIVNGGLFVGGATNLGLDPGTGTVTIANGGAIRASEGVTLAPDAGSFGTLNLGAAPGSAAVAPGTLDTPTVIFGNGTGAINFNHTAADYVFAAAISGPGAVNQIAGTTILSGNSTYTNATTISGGVLRVNGSLGNTAVTVDNGGKLGGSGSIAGPVTVAAGGIIAPGNSIGTLTLGGNFTQAAGAIYQVELNTAGQSDLLVVGGTATIQNGAVLQVIRADAATSPFVIGTRYTILAAAGGTNGTWSTLTGDAATAFIDLGFGQNTNGIYLDALRNNVRFADVGLSSNQRTTGAAVESLDGANPLYTAIVQSITPQAARTAFDLTSGEIHAGMASAAFDDSRAPRTAILDRLRDPSLNSATNLPANVPANFSDPARQPSPDAHAVWGRVIGDYGRIGGNDNTAAINRSLGGLIIGADIRLADRYRVGIVGGYTKSTLDLDARASSGSIESKFGGVYGGADFGQLRLRTGALYADNSYETNRSIVFPGFQDATRGSYSGSTAQAFGEAGWLMSASGMTIEPFAGLSLIRIHMNAFSETGGAAALQGQSRSYNYQATTTGIRVASTPLTGPILRGALGWQHVFGDTAPVSVMAFSGANSASTPFSITGAAVARDSLLAEAGIEWHHARGVSSGIFYSGVIGQNAYANTLQGRLMMEF
jgi:outer membrane autotransporter protein